jgi:hypothetical protein
MLVTQRAGVVAVQAHRAAAKRKADVLLDLLLGQAMPCLLASLA